MSTSKNQTVGNSTYLDNLPPATLVKNPQHSIDFNNLPPVTPVKIPQHVICMELAKKGYRAKQVSEITGIKLTNVSWYFSKYKLNEIALEALGVESKPLANVNETQAKPKSDKTSQAKPKSDKTSQAKPKSDKTSSKTK